MAQPDGPYADRISVPPEEDVDPTADEYHDQGVFCGEPSHCPPPFPGALPGTPYEVPPPADIFPLESLPPLPPRWSDPHLQELADQRSADLSEGLPDPLGETAAPAGLTGIPAPPDMTHLHDPGQPEEYAGADIPDPWASPAPPVVP